MLTQNSAQFPSIILVQPKAFTDGVVFVPLTKLTDFPTREYFVFGGLEIRLDYESAVVDESILVDDVEDLFVDIDESAGYEEAGRSVQFDVLLLLKHLDLFFGRDLFLDVFLLGVDFVHDFVAGLLQLQLDFDAFLFDFFLKFVIVISLSPEFDGLAGVPSDLIELKA